MKADSEYRCMESELKTVVLATEKITSNKGVVKKTQTIVASRGRWQDEDTHPLVGPV
jgi:hypothetical protein